MLRANTIYGIFAAIILELAAVFGAGATEASAAGFSNETLHYVISYKWGVVQKDAADATMSLRSSGNNYQVTLTARTKPWADKFFEVRDTLLCSVSKTKFQPLSYSKISHEGGVYRRDDIKYTHRGNTVGAAVTRTKEDKEGKRTVTRNQFTATGSAYDMLSVFYFLRTIDYASLAQNKTISTNIFSGSKVESLTIRYVGKERLKMRSGKMRDAIKITFSFTTNGKKKSSDNIEAWLSDDASHIPLQLIGKLPVGSVRVYLI